jgi:hypothetical protein
VTSHTTESFRRLFRQLPAAVQEAARTAYRLWRADPFHNSLRFKKVHPKEPIYSVRIGLGWRALGVRDGDTMIWYWIGSHADYDRLLSMR